jgi:rubrerythrin
MDRKEIAMTPENVEEILNFAIEGEQAAHDFYVDLAEKAEHPSMKDIFMGFAKEEAGHKKKLERIKSGTGSFPCKKDVTDLKIGDYLVEVDSAGTLSYQDALILAMKREKAAFRLYSDLAASTDDSELKSTFQGLAQEEAKHKLRFEVEYDDRILMHN